MMLLTKEILRKLPTLYATENVPTEDKVVQVKFFNPSGSWTLYVVEYDGEDTFFGITDDGEWGYSSLSEIKKARGRFGLKMERDTGFRPTKVKDIKELN